MEKLYRSSDLVRWCQVDTKTVHNWVEKGKIEGFRTPGRHLRFTRAAVLTFLRTYGFPVPAALSGEPQPPQPPEAA